MGRNISVPNFNASSVNGNYVDIPFFEEVDLIPGYSTSTGSLVISSVNYLKELNIITEERVAQILNKGI